MGRVLELPLTGLRGRPWFFTRESTGLMGNDVPARQGERTHKGEARSCLPRAFFFSGSGRRAGETRLEAEWAPTGGKSRNTSSRATSSGTDHRSGERPVCGYHDLPYVP
jgi:hypothetical protein